MIVAYSRGYIWARGEKIPGYLIFVDLPSLRPKWSGSKRILITFAPNTKSPHHILRANFVFSKKIIRKTYKTASTYMLKRPIKCLKIVFDVQNIIFVVKNPIEICFKYLLFQNFFGPPPSEKIGKKTGKTEKIPIFWH